MSEEIKFNPVVVPSPRLNEILSPEEKVAKIKEELQNAKQHLRHPAQNLAVGPENKEASEGVALEPNEFLRRLKKVGPNLIIDSTFQGAAVAIRMLDMDQDKDSPTFGQVVKKYVSGFVTVTRIPEFSSFINDQYGIPYREIRGWRSVLLMLMANRAITYADVKKEFGDPLGQRGDLWREQLREQNVLVVG